MNETKPKEESNEAKPEEKAAEEPKEKTTEEKGKEEVASHYPDETDDVEPKEEPKPELPKEEDETLKVVDKIIELEDQETKIKLLDVEGQEVLRKKGFALNMKNIYVIDGMTKRKLDNKNIKYELL